MREGERGRRIQGKKVRRSRGVLGEGREERGQRVQSEIGRERIVRLWERGRMRKDER
jgi:hypothetical protein